MNNGDFDRLITISAGDDVNTDGVVTRTYSDPRELFAEVVEFSGSERFRAVIAQDLSQRVARFRFWYFRKISFLDRITFDDEQWDIVNVKTEGRDEITELTAQVVK